MMRPRSIRIIALILAIVATSAAVLGWDLVYEQQVTDQFVSKPSGLDIF
jgi:Flp pilus assembly protein CpaB